MLPRSGSTDSVGSSASSWARRRTDAVPMRIPGRDARRRRARRADPRARCTRRPRVRRRRSRSCPWPSARRRRCVLSSSASSSSLTKTPRPPISPNGRVRSRSPAVVIGTSAISTPGRRSALAARSAWVSASLLPREPTRSSTAAARGRVRGSPHATAPRGRMRTNEVGACSGSGRARLARPDARSRALLLPQPEQVPHDISIDHARRPSRPPPSCAPWGGGGACSRSAP